MSSVLRAEREKSLRRRYGSRTAQRPVHGHGPGPGGPRGGGNARGGGQPREMKAVLKRLMAYLEQDRLKMGLAFFCVLVSTVTSLAGAYMLRPIINQFIAPADGSAGSVSGLAGGLAVMAAVYMASVAASYLQSRIILFRELPLFCLLLFNFSFYHAYKNTAQPPPDTALTQSGFLPSD